MCPGVPGHCDAQHAGLESTLVHGTLEWTLDHSSQAGFMEKAERYTDKAIVQVLDCTLLMCIVYTVLHMFNYFIDYF